MKLCKSIDIRTYYSIQVSGDFIVVNYTFLQKSDPANLMNTGREPCQQRTSCGQFNNLGDSSPQNSFFSIKIMTQGFTDAQKQLEVEDGIGMNVRKKVVQDGFSVWGHISDEVDNGCDVLDQ